MEGKKDDRSRNWLCTLNNYTEEEKAKFPDVTCVYGCYGEEIAPTTGTPHLQMFFQFKNAVRLASVLQIYRRGHWEIANPLVKNSAWVNRAYCSKTRVQDLEPNEVFVEKGKIPVPNPQLKGQEGMLSVFDFSEMLTRMLYPEGGEATKELWDETKALAKSGAIDDIDSKIFICHYNTLKTIGRDYGDKPDDLEAGSQVGYWFYGDSGTGKTFSAIREFPGAYRKISNNKWWCGYQGEENVIIDDLDKEHKYMGYHLKIWGDRYAFNAESKGSSRFIRPKRVVVTSNYHPNEIWEDKQTLGPIRRRFKVIRFVNLMHADDDAVHTVDEIRNAYVHGFNPPPVPEPVLFTPPDTPRPRIDFSWLDDIENSE